jgi:hypothetical protein
MIRREFLRLRTDACLECGSGCETLQTVSMVRAEAVERVRFEPAHAKMTHFWMEQPMVGGAIDDKSSADARPNCEVEEAVDIRAGSPDVLGKSCSIHICIYGDRTVESLKGLDDVDV